MAYAKTRPTLIARRGYSGLGDVGSFLQNVLSSYGTSQQQAGAATQAASDAAAVAAAKANASGGGISIGDVALVGGIGLAAVLLLRKKKS